MHLDHFQDATLIDEALRTAADLGVSSIMVDAAHLPYRDNVEQTRAFTERAHSAGLWAEAELGEIGGKEGDARGRTHPVPAPTPTKRCLRRPRPASTALPWPSAAPTR